MKRTRFDDKTDAHPLPPTTASAIHGEIAQPPPGSPPAARRAHLAVTVSDLRIMLTAVLVAIGYGIAHDLITAHLCLEYFTIAHPRLFAADIPALHALAWGVLATWWVGLFLGALLALVAKIGKRPPAPPRELTRLMLKLALITGACALLAGGAALALVLTGRLVLHPDWQTLIPPERHVGFMVAAWMHLTSYAVAFVGGIVLCVLVWLRRGRAQNETTVPAATP